MPTNDPIDLILRVAQLRFRGAAQKEIAEQLNISPSMVSRLVAKAKNYVDLRFRIPPVKALQNQLIQRFGLRDAVVVETGIDEYELIATAHAAAEYFNGIVADTDRIALSCGETLLELILDLPTRRDAAWTITQLSAEADHKAIHQSPVTLVGILRSKCGRKSCANAIQLPPPQDREISRAYRDAFRRSSLFTNIRSHAEQARIVLVGVGNPLDESSVSGHHFLSTIEQVMNRKTFLDKASALGIVGEMNNQLYDADGQDRTAQIEPLEDAFVNLLSLADIKLMANTPTADGLDRYVIAVAAGDHKISAIRAALNRKMVNVLVTSKRCAEALLDG